MPVIAKTTYRERVFYVVEVAPLRLSSDRCNAHKFMDEEEAKALLPDTELGVFEFKRVRVRRRK